MTRVRVTKREVMLMVISAAAVAGAFAAWEAAIPHPAGGAAPGGVASDTAGGAPPAATPAPDSLPAPGTPFLYTFNTSEILYEAGSLGQSSSPYWWVNSGAELVLKNGIGSTIEGSLPADDPWRVLYGSNNPRDTDGGYHPQNIFRLVTRSEWTDYAEEAYFKVDAVNLSASPNRNESNGLLLFNRYQDAFNLYYAGVRVDGTAVIKKKVNGIYYTMAQSPIFDGTYDPVHDPNLIPLDTWIGLRTVVTAPSGNAVDIKLYVDVGRTGNWVLVAHATDGGTEYGGAPIGGPAHAGIRTDFMDVSFEDFSVTPLP